MDDKQLLEEHALQRARLVGMLLHGTAWRERPSRGALRRLLVGVILGAVACAAIAAGGFIADQVASGRLGARPAAPVVTPSQRP
jgi:hypothetical protein